MKKCSGCTKRKQLSEFYKRKSGERAGEYYEKCKKCLRTRGKNYYHLNKRRQLPLALARRKKAYILKKNYLIEAKSNPCVDCDQSYPHYVMDFDHRKPDDKIISVSLAVVRNWSLERIKAEISKCELVCANCHRIRTYKNLS